MSAETQPIRAADFAAAISDLSDELIISLKQKLEVSINKLEETNSFLQTEIEAVKKTENGNGPNGGNQDDIKLYSDTIDENKEVISSQNERTLLVQKELEKRGLGGPKLEEGEKPEEIDGANRENDGGIDL